MSRGEIPSRDAVLRSIFTESRSPLSSRSLETSRSSGRAESRHDAGRPGQELAPLRVLERVLVLRAAGTRVDREVLDGLEEERDALDLRQSRAQAAHDLGDGLSPLVERLQVDLDAAAV